MLYVFHVFPLMSYSFILSYFLFRYIPAWRSSSNSMEIAYNRIEDDILLFYDPTTSTLDCWVFHAVMVYVCVHISMTRQRSKGPP